MSEANKPKPDDADELSELLDESLKDFKQAKPAGRTTDDDLDDWLCEYDASAAKKAASDFQSMLQQMVQIQEEADKKGQEFLPEADEDVMNVMKQLMECTGQMANASSQEDYLAGFNMLSNPDTQMGSFASAVMRTLASKELMYPSLKEIHDKFPKFLEDHPELDAETKERYQKQYECLGKICGEYEKQDDQTEEASVSAQAGEDAAPVDGEENVPKEFQKIAMLLVELQTYGRPPVELTGEIPEGWGIDESSGLPRVDDASKALDACCIM